VATGEQAQHRRQWLAGAMLIMLVAGAAWWTAWRADGDLRGELLQQARLAAQAVDVERVGLLTGTVADLESPDHHRMKEQFAVVGASLPAGRLLRLIGRKADGTLFVLVDGAAAGTQAAPPAQVDAAPADLRAVFDGKDGAVAGPLSDRLWPRVSAWIPIRDKADLSGFGTPDDAQAMVRKAVDFYRQNGRERFIAECNNPQGQFRRGNLYAFAYDLDMTMRAHPVTPELVGHNLLDKQDRSGSQDFRKEIQDVALSRGSGWVDYPYQNPANGKIEPKTTYVERVDDLIIASGAYQSSGEVVAALAMDIDSRTWQWEVAIRSAVPVGLMLALLIATIAGLVLKRRVDAAPKPLLRRLLAPLAAIIVLLTFGTAALLWQQYQRQLAANLARHVAEVAGEWQGLLEQQSAGLAMTGQLIAADATVQKALRAGDGERLLAAWQPVFATLKRENQLTHFYFLDRNRVCLLRVHRPALRGDVINRFTARAAERTGKTATGIELGPLGTFTLRVVRPVFAGGTLVGYVELGKEIEDLMDTLQYRSGSLLAVLIHKEHLTRQAWEDGMRLLNREAYWDRLAHSVLTYPVQGQLPNALVQWADHAGGAAHRAREGEVVVDGKDFFVSAIPLHDVAGQDVGDLLVMRDISAENEAFTGLLIVGGSTGGVLLMLLLSFIVVLLRRADAGIRAREAALQNTLQFQKDLLEAVPSPIYCKDAQGIYIASNKAFERYLGRSHEEIIGKTVHDLGPVDLADKYDQADRDLLTHLGAQTYEASVLYADGTRHEVVFNKATFTDAEGQVAGLIGVIFDITERKRAEEKLHLAASVFTYAREGILITTADGTIIDVNDAFSRITGYGRDEVVGQNPRLLSSGRHDQAFYADMWRALIDTGHWHGEIWNRRKSGEVFVEMQTISSVRDALGKPREYVSLFSDITVLKENERRLERIANYDALTGLPNRVLLSDRLRQGMAQAQRQGHLLAVAFLDLDGFKAINDSHGHKAGDELLIGVATRMTATLRESDTLARIGGDEFVAVLFDLADAAASEPMLSRLLAAAADPVPAGNLLLQVSASLGVTFYPQAAEVNADQLMRQADQAMYQAKLAGKNRYHVFDAEQDRSVRGHHQSVERVQRALTEHQFVLHYQPKVNLRTGVMLGAEALIRWQHPEKGLLPPAVFLPTIADHPLAIAVGEWMIDAALEQIGRWNALGLSIPVSVNVGARHLQQANFVERLRALLAKHPSVRPCELDLEVQETSALKGLPRVAQLIDACREIGVSFSLDDFGSGYSSLTYLKRLSVSQIKIDQSFVRNMFDDPGELAILDAVLGLATAFGRLVIANGMETVPHGEMLLRLGCEHAQGYGIAPPMPADELARWSLAWRPDPAWARLPAVLSRDDLLEQLQTLLQQRRQ